MKATKATNSRGKSATELEEVKEKKETQIFSKWNDTDFKICTKTKQRIKCNEIKGEEHEETVEFFLTIYHSYNFVNIFPVAMPSEMATIITGRPTHKERKKIETFHCLTIPFLAIRRHDYSFQCKLWNHKLTPWDDVIHVHFGVDVVNFHNEEVEVNSLDQHPTENGHQEILHQSCYCNTGSLWKERVFA